MSFKKIISTLVVLCLICFVFCGCESERKEFKPTEQFYVNDFAGVINEKDETALLNKAIALDKATTAQLVVVTVDSLNGETPEEFALNLGRAWGVGDKEKNNGIVVLLAVKEREIRIEIGYGLEGDLPDSKTGRIIDYYGLDYLKNDNFSAGLYNVTNALINEVYIAYGQTPEESYVEIDDLPQTNNLKKNGSKVIISWIILIVLIVIISLLGSRRGGGGMGPMLFFMGGPRFYSGSSFGGGRGGFGGGGGFSGGGGSFGGGGAGRRF